MNHTSIQWKTVLRNSTTLAQINTGGSLSAKDSDNVSFMGTIRMIRKPLVLATSETSNKTKGKSPTLYRATVPLGIHNFNFYTF